MLRSALSQAFRHSACVSLRSFHNRIPQAPLALSQWSEPTGDGLVPIVVEQTVCGPCAASFRPLILHVAQGRGERSYDIFSRLLRERVIMLYGPVCTSHHPYLVSRLNYFRFGTPTLRSSLRNSSSSKPRRHQNPSTYTSTHPAVASLLV